MLKLIVFITAIRLLLLSSCLMMPATVSKRGSGVQICGRMLAQTLNLLCEGQYYDPGEQSNDISKRDIAQQMPDDYYPGWYLGIPSVRISKMSHYKYPQYHQYTPSRRQERGVVDECCKKACPVTVLMSYCRPATT